MHVHDRDSQLLGFIELGMETPGLQTCLKLESLLQKLIILRWCYEFCYHLQDVPCLLIRDYSDLKIAVLRLSHILLIAENGLANLVRLRFRLNRYDESEIPPVCRRQQQHSQDFADGGLRAMAGGGGCILTELEGLSPSPLTTPLEDGAELPLLTEGKLLTCLS